MNELNRQLFDSINGWPNQLEPILRFFSEATNYLAFKLFLVSLTLFLAWKPGPRRRAAIQSLLAFPLANGLTDLFKHDLARQRPCNDLSHFVFHGIGCSESMGTASAHSANMAAVAFVFVYHLKWWGSPWVPIAFLTGISRVYVGAHYPYQVLLGWTCGVVAAVAVTQVAKFIQMKRSNVVKNGDGKQSELT